MEPTPAVHGSLASDEPSDSEKDDLAAFLAGLKKRYNIEDNVFNVQDASVEDAKAASASTAAALPAPDTAAHASSPARASSRNEVSSDAAILNLHPAFRATGSRSSPAQPAQPGAAGGRAPGGHSRDEQSLSGWLSPGEAANTVQLQWSPPARLQLQQKEEEEEEEEERPRAVQGSLQVNAATSAVGTGAPAAIADDQATSTPGESAQTTMAAGAVAAVATPHTTAAMPSPTAVKQQQGPVHPALGFRAEQQPSPQRASASAMSPLSPQAAGVDGAVAAAINISSVRKPLLLAFAVAAEADAPDSDLRTDAAGPAGMALLEGSPGQGFPSTPASAAPVQPGAVSTRDPASQAAASGAAQAVLLDWSALSNQLTRAGFGPLTFSSSAADADADATNQEQLQAQPELASVLSTFFKVLLEFQRRDVTMAQLLAERDQLRREALRTTAEAARLEKQRDEAIRTAEKAKAELADVRQSELPALEARHKQAAARSASELAKTKQALREAEQAALAAQQAAAGQNQAALQQQQLAELCKEKERLSVELERLASEQTRHKLLAREAEKAAAVAQATAKQSSDQVSLLERELREARQQHQEEVTALTAELSKSRHATRDAEVQLAAHKSDAASEGGELQGTRRTLAAERTRHEEQQAHLTSEVQKLRQQLLQLQQAAAKAEAAAKADSSAAAFTGKQLALQEKLQQAEMDRLASDLKQTRGMNHQLQSKLQQAEAAAAAQQAAATQAAADALEASESAAAVSQELERSRASSRQQLQHLGQQLLDARKALAETQQQLSSAQAELRRVRAAAGLLEAAPGAAVAPEDAGTGGARGLSIKPLTAAKVVDHYQPSSTADSRAAGPAAAGSGAAASEGQLPPGPGAGDSDLAAALSRAVRAEAAVADAESALVSLRYKVLQLEAANSRREQEVEAVKDRLAEKVAREERRLAADKRAYARIRQAYAASRRSGPAAVAAQRAAAGAVAAAARELRPIELVGLYESQKEVLEQEAATAKAEVRVLSSQLRDAQNLLISRDRAAAVAAAAAGLRGAAATTGLGDPAAAVAAQRKAAEAQRELSSVRSEAAAALREGAKRLAAAEARCSSLTDDVGALQQELNSRPTHAQHRQLQREVDILQRKIASVRREQALAAPGAAAVAGEDCLAAAGGAWPPGEGAPAAAAAAVAATRSARAAIQRDKAIARLGLAVVEEFPRDVLVDLVQDVCVVLELRDATLLVPNLRKMSAVLGAIPRLEAFVAQVCELCFRQGLMYVPEELVQDLNPGAVPKVLQHWINLLQQGEQLRQLVDHLQQLLSLRCGSEGPPTPDNAPGGTNHLALMPAQPADLLQLQQLGQKLLRQVQELLQVEMDAVAADDVVAAAKGLMATQPDGLLQRLVAQVQQLFEVPSLEGLPAAMNRVYVHYNELLNFFKAVAVSLALPADAGPQTAMMSINNLVRLSDRQPTKVRLAAAQLQHAAGISQTHESAGRHAAAMAAGDGTRAAHHQSTATGQEEAQLQALLAAVGAGSVQQAVTSFKDMKQRLERLDQVLPRYQNMASQLYDRLRVVALDEVIPALDRTLAQAAS